MPYHTGLRKGTPLSADGIHTYHDRARGDNAVHHVLNRVSGTPHAVEFLGLEGDRPRACFDGKQLPPAVVRDLCAQLGVPSREASVSEGGKMAIPIHYDPRKKPQ